MQIGGFDEAEYVDNSSEQVLERRKAVEICISIKDRVILRSGLESEFGFGLGLWLWLGFGLDLHFAVGFH